jgi:hypothetical protein
MKPEQLEIAQLKREVIRLKAERDILKNHLGQRPPVGVETVEVYPLGGRERPTAFWWQVTPQKNMVHGLLRVGCCARESGDAIRRSRLGN